MTTIYDYLVAICGTPSSGYEWFYECASVVIVLFALGYLIRVVAKLLTGGRL